MTKLNLKVIFIALLMSFGITVTSSSIAQADKLRLSLSIGTPHHLSYWQPWWGISYPQFRILHMKRKFCHPRRALRKARIRGIRHARLLRVSHRGTTITGRKFGKRIKVRFAPARHCPVKFAKIRL